MKNKIFSYLNRTQGLKTARRGIVLALTLALLSYNFGSGVLQSLGATGTDAPTCGLEEHMHTQDCYTSVLSCEHTEGPDGSAPIHDGTCYTSQLICDKEEHVHTDECYAEAVENTVSGSDAQKNLTLVSLSNDIVALDTLEALEASEAEKVKVKIDGKDYFTNTIYMKRGSEGDFNIWTNNDPSTESLDLNIGDEFTIMAIMAETDLAMYEPNKDDGKVWPNTNECGFKSESIAIDYEQNYPSKLEDTGDYWQLKATCQALKTGEKFTITLTDDKNNILFTSPMIEVTAEEENSEVLYINTPYGSLDKHTATNIVSGLWKQDNSANNPYVLYVGETLEIVAEKDSTGQFWTIDNTKDSESQPTLKSETGTATSYLATTPGEYKITLKESPDSSALSTFYFVVKYPIYVETAIGEVHKDKVHEYLEAAGHNYNKTPQDFITSPSSKEKNEALYVKNSANQRYVMYPQNEVTLSTYYVASADPVPTFTATDALTLKNGPETKPGKIIDGKNFTKVTATFIARESDYAQVTLSNGKTNETFEVYVRNTNYTTDDDFTKDANHFDIEIADGSTYTDKITTIYADGSSKIVTTDYSARVDRVNSCTVINTVNGKPGILEADQYHDHGTEGGTQHELTSAYDADNHFVTRSEFIGPAVAEVKFNINIHLDPLPQGRTVKKIAATGETEKIEIGTGDADDMEKVEYTLGALHILDALNKCPAHNGYDFTVLSGNERINLAPAVHKTLEGPNGTKLDLKEGQFTFGLWTDPDLTKKPDMTATNNQDGNVYFKDIEDLGSNGETNFVYFIKEISDPQQEDIEYDSTVYRMTVNVEDTPTVSYECSENGDDPWVPYTGSIPEFTNIDTAPAPAEVTPTAHKTLVYADGSELNLTPGQFSFELRDAASGAIIDTAKNDQDGNVTFKKLTFSSKDFDKVQQYVYYIKETAGTEKNIKYDTTIYKMTVDLTNNEAEGKIVPTVTYARLENGTSWPPYTGALEFVNTDTTPVEVTPLVHKTLLDSNRSRLNLKQGQFTFGLWSSSDLSQEPDMKVSNDQNGNVSFGTIKYSSEDFDKAQKYVYYIKEITGTDKNIIYDTTTYRMIVTLTKNEADGRIVANVTYARAETENSTSWPTYTGTLEFVNTDTSTSAQDPATVTPAVHKTLENTNGYKLNLKQGQFRFGLYTDLSRNPVEIVSNDQNGNAVFTKLTFNSEDLDKSNEWVYYIQEINDQQTGIKYDSTIYRMTVTLSSNASAGAIVPSVRYSYSVNGGNTWNSYNGTPEFVNKDTAAAVDITVEKVWDDNNSKDRPESVVIQLLKDDNTVYGEVTLSGSNNWHYTWTSLDSNIKWSVQEANIPEGYAATYKASEDGLHFTVTNTASLPQTGQLNWPIPVLFGCGLILITLGSVWERSGRKKESDEN